MFDAIMRPEFVDAAATSWDVVGFVPLHRRRRRQRGFDQADLLSRGVAQKLDLVRTTGLQRIIDTPSQVGRGEQERQTNVRDAFAWKGESLDGAHVLLIDDVVTTGATMLAACDALLAAGARRVDGFALARELQD